MNLPLYYLYIILDLYYSTFHSKSRRKPYNFDPLGKILHNYDKRRLPQEIPRNHVEVLDKRDMNALGEGVQGRVCQVRILHCRKRIRAL